MSPFLFATALVGMGKREEALDALEDGYKARDGIVGFNFTPRFGPLSSEPRF